MATATIKAIRGGYVAVEKRTVIHPPVQLADGTWTAESSHHYEVALHLGVCNTPAQARKYAKRAGYTQFVNE